MDCTVSVLDLVCLPNSSRSEQCVNTVICVCFLHQVWVCVCVPGSEHKHTVDKKLGHLEGCNLAEHMNVILRH